MVYRLLKTSAKKEDTNMPYGIQLAQALGGQAASGLLNQGMGLLLAGPQRKAQMKTAKEMQALQMQGDKEMTDYNLKKQMELWEATGYGAQVDQMKRAGINPALLYGMGSGGGQTANIEQGNVSGQHAETPKANIGGEGMGLMIGQMGLLEAQKKNIEADTKLKEVDAAKKAGVDTEEAKGRIKGLSLNNEFLQKTMDDRVDIINSEMGKAINELTLQDGAIARERGTRTADITKAMAEAANTLLTSQLIKAQTDEKRQNIEESKASIHKMSAEINKWAEEIAQSWTGLDRQERELKLKGWEAEMKAKYPGLWNVLGRVANETANGIGRIFGKIGDTEKTAPIDKK